MYVRLMMPGGKQRRVGVRNVVAACWSELVEGGDGLELDGQGRVAQDGRRVVHRKGDACDNRAGNLRVVPGRVARRRAPAAPAVQAVQQHVQQQQQPQLQQQQQQQQVHQQQVQQQQQPRCTATEAFRAERRGPEAAAGRLQWPVPGFNDRGGRVRGQ